MSHYHAFKGVFLTVCFAALLAGCATESHKALESPGDGINKVGTGVVDKD